MELLLLLVQRRDDVQQCNNSIEQCFWSIIVLAFRVSLNLASQWTDIYIVHDDLWADHLATQAAHSGSRKIL